jgi:hypothetical protein
MNVFLLDGANNTDGNTFAVTVIPPMESVQEFRIQSSLASAAFSQAGGGVVDGHQVGRPELWSAFIFSQRSH